MSAPRRGPVLAGGPVVGLQSLADALCAITNPTVNSYKRLNASGTNSGATWAPNSVKSEGSRYEAAPAMPVD